MKKALTLILVVFFLVSPGRSFAHSIAGNSDVKILVHTDPDDHPVAGDNSHIHLFLENEDGPLMLKDCACSMEIIKNKVTLALFPIVGPNGERTEFIGDYTFPEQGQYKLHIFGQAKDDKFDINFDLIVYGKDLGVQNKPKANVEAYKSLQVMVIVVDLLAISALLFLTAPRNAKRLSATPKKRKKK